MSKRAHDDKAETTTARLRRIASAAAREQREVAEYLRAALATFFRRNSTNILSYLEKDAARGSASSILYFGSSLHDLEFDAVFLAELEALKCSVNSIHDPLGVFAAVFPDLRCSLVYRTDGEVHIGVEWGRDDSE